MSVREVGDAVVEAGGRTVAELFGPVVSGLSSPYYVGATRGTNQTGELTAVVQALLWLRDNAAGRAAVIAVDSVYAAGGGKRPMWNSSRLRSSCWRRYVRAVK